MSQTEETRNNLIEAFWELYKVKPPNENNCQGNNR